MTDQNSFDGVRAHPRQAALELFGEHDYDRTTAAAIAACVGITERTFFRYFPDKRETLFGGEAVLRPALTRPAARAVGPAVPRISVAGAAARSGPVLRRALTAGGLVGTRAPRTRAGQAGDAGRCARRRTSGRGVGKQSALLAARTGMAAFTHVTVAWFDTPEPGLSERLDLVLQDLRALLDRGVD